MDNLPATIDEVLTDLDGIIAEAALDNNYLVIFAYVYRRTTAEIRNAILQKQFSDNERMERLDVAFANKYLAAYRNYKNATGPVARAWSVSFQSEHEKLTIMQHLLMGMNAHINLDLGIAASEVAGGNSINDLKSDFMKVNEILASLTKEMQVRVGRISWWMFLVNLIGGSKDDSVINFSMVKARQASWNFACSLALCDGVGKQKLTEEVDAIIAGIAGIIKNPPGLVLRSILKFIAKFEEKDVKKILAGLLTD